MMKPIKLLLFCFLIAVGALRAQIYPVQISAQLVPPYSGYLPDYADPTAEKLKVILQFNDFSQAQYNLKLKFEIKGNGFTISTKALFNPSPITLLPGQPLLLSGADLAPYLNTNNLDFVGINQSQYQQKMALPEGYYSICIKAYDYYNSTPIQVSNEACANAWFTLSDPPYLNLPICNTALTPLTPQNIIFQWTPVNLASPTSAFSTEYEFSLWECRPDSNANANQIVLSAAPIFSTTTQQTSFNYGLAEPPLNLYMKYIWRVRAKDITGRELFKNNGYSQICTFTYGTVKNIFGNTLALSLTARPLTHRTGECTFTKQSVYSKYLLQVRKKNTNYWFDFPNTTGLERIPNLEPRTVYECRVRGEAGTLIGDWSNIAEFKTLDPPNYTCNDNTLAPFNNLQPLPSTKAVAGLVIQSGQFEVIATQIFPNGPPGWYRGKGYAIIFGAVPVAVQWNSIFIDAEQRQQQGIIEALTQGVNKWIANWQTENSDGTSFYSDQDIDTVYVNNLGEIVIKFPNGSTTVVPWVDKTNPYQVTDKTGNTWLVFPPNGDVIEVTEEMTNIIREALKLIRTENSLNQISQLNQTFNTIKQEIANYTDSQEAAISEDFDEGFLNAGLDSAATLSQSQEFTTKSINFISATNNLNKSIALRGVTSTYNHLDGWVYLLKWCKFTGVYLAQYIQNGIKTNISKQTMINNSKAAIEDHTNKIIIEN
jgi:hypothetical protein